MEQEGKQLPPAVRVQPHFNFSVPTYGREYSEKITGNHHGTNHQQLASLFFQKQRKNLKGVITVNSLQVWVERMKTEHLSDKDELLKEHEGFDNQLSSVVRQQIGTLQSLQTEISQPDMSSTTKEERLDIRARSSKNQNQNAFFDVRVTNPLSESSMYTPMSVICKKLATQKL